MFFNIVNSRAVTLGIALVVWVLGAAALRAWPTVSTEQPRALAGSGGVLAMLGGMRAAVANGCWLRVNEAWERRDAAGTEAWVALTVAADERPAYFWLNGARILAYDLPEWERDPNAPAAVQRRRVDTQARRAVAFLEQGLRRHGPDAALYVELANLHWRRLGDLERAAEYYRRAAKQPTAPAYAVRIYGELLRTLGRPREALTWLREVLPTLDATDPLARRDVVLARIAALEAELGER
jgi:tetratricopeptide (TPR) repeat protein